MSAASVVLAALEATGEVICLECPGCKALVNLAEGLAKLALTQSTEAQQVASAEEAILDADQAAVNALAAANVVVAPSPVVAAAAAAASSVVAVASPEVKAPEVKAPEAAPPPGTVASWK